QVSGIWAGQATPRGKPGPGPAAGSMGDGAITARCSIGSSMRGREAVYRWPPGSCVHTRRAAARAQGEHAVAKLVYAFTEGNKDLKDLLGGKGANLAEMTNIGLPVPPGFTITTEACRYFLAHGGVPEGLAGEVAEHLARMEQAMGRRLGDPADPLLVSVRSGAKFSMPGMMDTVLNIGITD